MRDGAIIQGMRQVGAHVDHNIKILHDTNTLQRTRIDAIEQVLFGRRFSILVCIFGQMISPRWVKNLVTEVHAEMIADYNQKRQEAAARISIVKATGPAVLNQLL